MSSNSRNGVYVINRGLETRRSKTGKVRHSIRIDAEPIIIDQDPKRLGKPVAEQIANHYRERVRGIAATASAATIKARKVAAKAFAEGKAWALKRYAGGRTGALPPNQSTALFNDSGRFANTIVAGFGENAWRINVAANRLNSETVGQSSVDRIWNRLVSLIPEFGNAALLMENAILKRTIERVSKERVTKGRMSDKELTPFQAFSLLHLRTGTDE
jgi:hypothetical protein